MVACVFFFFFVTWKRWSFTKLAGTLLCGKNYGKCIQNFLGSLKLNSPSCYALLFFYVDEMVRGCVFGWIHWLWFVSTQKNDRMILVFFIFSVDDLTEIGECLHLTTTIDYNSFQLTLHTFTFNSRPDTRVPCSSFVHYDICF